MRSFLSARRFELNDQAIPVHINAKYFLRNHHAAIVRVCAAGRWLAVLAGETGGAGSRLSASAASHAVRFRAAAEPIVDSIRALGTVGSIPTEHRGVVRRQRRGATDLRPRSWSSRHGPGF